MTNSTALALGGNWRMTKASKAKTEKLLVNRCIPCARFSSSITISAPQYGEFLNSGNQVMT
jgi:hypothetical protein